MPQRTTSRSATIPITADAGITQIYGRTVRLSCDLSIPQTVLKYVLPMQQQHKADQMASSPPNIDHRTMNVIGLLEATLRCGLSVCVAEKFDVNTHGNQASPT